MYTPSGPACRSDVTGVVFPATDGQRGVLASHAPMVTLLGAGLMTVTLADGGQKEYFVSGGFANCHPEVLTLLPDECDDVAVMDRDEAWDRIESARSLPQRNDTEREYRHAKLEVALKRFNTFQLSKRRGKDRA